MAKGGKRYENPPPNPPPKTSAPAKHEAGQV